MPVQKFTSFEEAEKSLWNFSMDDAHFRRVRELWDFADKLCTFSYPKGVFKFRSLEEAHAHRQRCQVERAEKKFYARHKSACRE